MSEDHEQSFGAAGPGAPALSAALRSRCPRCGKGRLYAGFLTLAPRCAGCGLDFALIDTGDGPAVFVILIVGFLIVGAALITEVVYAPPYWLHLVIWVPLTLILSLGLLRPVKSALIVMQYKHKAAQGRLSG